MDQAEQLCEHVCIIAQGRKVLDGRLRDVRRENIGNAYRVQFDSESESVDAFMARFGAAAREGEGWRLELPEGTDTRALVTALNGLDVPLMRFQREQPSLHDIFVSRVAGAAQTRRQEVAHV
jgi:ABC-2 type transport system ATP-binding protein